MLGAVPLSDFVPKLMCSVQLRTSVKTRIWARIFSSVGSPLWDASKTLSGIVKKGCDQFQRLQLRCSSPSCVSAVREARLPCYFTITLSLVSAKLTKCHASEGSPISLALQTFYLSISLSSNGHTFTFYQLHKVQVGLHNFSAIINLSIFSVSESEKVRKEVHRHAI